MYLYRPEPSTNPYTAARHAKDLVNELGDIKVQMKHILAVSLQSLY